MDDSCHQDRWGSLRNDYLAYFITTKENMVRNVQNLRIYNFIIQNLERKNVCQIFVHSVSNQQSLKFELTCVS